MNDKERKDYDTPVWWAEYHTPQPETPLEETYVEPDNSKKKFVIIGIIVGVIVLALIGCGAAYAIMHQDAPALQPEPKEVTEEHATKTSEVFVTVTADNPDETISHAKVSVRPASEDPEANNEPIIQDAEAVPNQSTFVGSLEPGSYLIEVTTLPENSQEGVIYQLPYSDTSFDVTGDGKPVEVYIYLPIENKAEEKAPEESEGNEESEAPQSETPISKPEPAPDTSSPATPSNNNSSTPSNSGGSSNKPTHTHNWVAQTKTVHHDAVYRTVHHDAVKERRTICDTCGADITGAYASHKNSTGHTSYSYKNIVTKEAYDEKVLVSAAYNEKVTTGYKCSGCGKTK